MPRLPLIARLAIEPAYAIGSRLHRAGINPTAAAIATVAAAVAVAVSIQDRAFIVACQNAGGSVELCTLKVSGR